VDRRSFLKKGLLGGALLLLGSGTALALRPGRHLASPTTPLCVLDDRGFQVLVAIAARVAPAGEADPVAIAQAVDASLMSVPPEVRTDLSRVLLLFENALPAFLLDRRVTPFTALAPDAQDAVLAAWRDSHLTLRRSAYNALRRLCLGAHYADQRSWKAIHYGGPLELNGFFHDDSRAGAS
jgi:hypothetical protein